MRIAGAVRTAVATAAALVLVTSCGASGAGDKKKDDAGSGHAEPTAAPTKDLKAIPGIGDRLRSRIPGASHQVVAVYGEGVNSADSTVVLWTKHGSTWDRTSKWAAHNGKKGWSTDHRENDNRSPVGVYTLSDAGGVLADPGAKLPYTQTSSIQAPHYWAKSHWHDFDYVIAIDYNRVKGTPPNNPTRPQGQTKGGSIWLHMDHGSGTSACVSLPKPAMRELLRTIDPAEHPVVVMGDKAHLKV
ncbi:L,D-transpeptidase family protein [Streptomyces tsukubensis]|uniref:L,D-TPase catalytic domain-containing protein n=1 Tax=Streptomyces tsukubensis TaxID=83656 RepID=A0A1V4A207_9ACTN|nr:L,D-transpeptidase family protein [Streptomyces tsukubensis]OON72437.1 hypothetical protein B1H18_29845 [Streptomyces tsukubensis]QFR96967.1 L,D-transpeptidase family protein [Streptomyces tsukubensis]